MQGWIETIKFLNEIGLLPLVLLLLAIPGGLILSLIAMKRFLFKTFSLKEAWDDWFLDQKERTAIEVKLELRITELGQTLKEMIAANWDLRRFFDGQQEDAQKDHKVIIMHLENILLLANKRRSDWIREPAPEMYFGRDRREAVKEKKEKDEVDAGD